ncbi:hypothetical protein [Herbiconiux sp. L3-i23]|uniref:hypothetical protein n=1 Tax=Herbiconiux sp. L3-i23 TaxID=2905871 RepID=UPI002063FD8F|nr:hypothetical protein [Herbiconiux sp. L3-i23]BDI23458.1 hypothetical protein L3i23_22340 [Herbiconiux sp. L3-i23]
MTLTEILPSLRRSIPDPLDSAVWPDHTIATTTDLLCGGVSLVRLADLCETPCVHTADRRVAGPRADGPLSRELSVVVVTVILVGRDPAGHRTLLVDALLDGALPRFGHARLIGRASTARRTPAALLPHTSDDRCGDVEVPMLPDDLVAGDLLALPCRGALRHGDIVVAAQAGTTDTPGPRCGR